jgi:AcrR family transcriptional regulator
MPVARSSRRPTQLERRTATIRKLLDAATEALIDVGYAEASVQAICARAGVSQGALFRHFPTREALMVAVGEDVGRRQLARYRRAFEKVRLPAGEPLLPAMRLVRASCRSRLNAAWYELAMAARTRKPLRRALEPVGARFYADIDALARQLLPELAAQLGPRFGVFVDTVLAVFDGEVVHRYVVRKPHVDEARLDLLGAFAELVAAAGRRGSR